jgi:general secretion pathway protein F
MYVPDDGQPVSRSVADFILLNEEIAALVRARLPLETNLANLAADLPKSSAELAKQIGRRMEGGASLATAMEAECASLPAAYRAVIVAGVESGQLGSALESLADSASRRDQLRRVTGIAILYPLVIVVAVCMLVAVVISQVVPSFAWLNNSHYGPIGSLAGVPWLVFVLGGVLPAVVLLSAGVWWWKSGRVGSSSSAGLGAFTWLPWVGQMHAWGQAATLSDLLRLLVERGLPLDQSLVLAAEATEVSRFRNSARKLADELRQGNTAASSAPNPADHAGLPSLVQLSLRHIHDRRLLASSLQQASEIYHDRAVRRAESYAERLPIVLTVGVGGSLTLGFTLLVFWPYVNTLYELAEWNWR